MRQLCLIAHNLRSCHNVGSLLRTSDGLGVKMVWLTGYTPYPLKKQDSRLPLIARKLTDQIAKTALGAEQSDLWQQADDVFSLIEQLKSEGYLVVALEQTDNAVLLADYASQLDSQQPVAIVLGREVEGIETAVLEACDAHVEIPMHGSKESFNVSIAAAIAAYELLR